MPIGPLVDRSVAQPEFQPMHHGERPAKAQREFRDVSLTRRAGRPDHGQRDLQPIPSTDCGRASAMSVHEQTIPAKIRISHNRQKKDMVPAIHAPRPRKCSARRLSRPT